MEIIQQLRILTVHTVQSYPTNGNYSTIKNINSARCERLPQHWKLFHVQQFFVLVGQGENGGGDTKGEIGSCTVRKS